MKKSELRLETARFILRPFEPKDESDLYEMLSNDEAVRFEPYEAMSAEQAKKALDERIGSDEWFAIEEKSSHKVIGSVFIAERYCNSREIGYLIDPRYWRKGCAFEAVSEVVRRTFELGVHRIEACCDVRNESSWRMLEKLGFRREAHLERDIYFRTDENGAPIWKDTYIYSLLNVMTVNGKPYDVCGLLGKGKGGYSYLVTDGETSCVLKQIHHEPCEYYTFGNKLGSELCDYERLEKVGIPMPKLLGIDEKQERLLKEYIPGDTAAELVEKGKMKPEYIAQVEEMCRLLYANGLNIDYYPTNFLLKGERLFYVDYECNEYMQEWDFDHWGRKYWEQQKKDD